MSCFLYYVQSLPSPLSLFPFPSPLLQDSSGVASRALELLHTVLPSVISSVDHVRQQPLLLYVIPHMHLASGSRAIYLLVLTVDSPLFIVSGDQLRVQHCPPGHARPAPEREGHRVHGQPHGSHYIISLHHYIISLYHYIISLHHYIISLHH